MDSLQLCKSMNSFSALCFCSVAIFQPLFLFLSLLGCFYLFTLLGLFFFLLSSLYSTQMIIFTHYRKMKSCHCYYAFNSILSVTVSSCLQNVFDSSLSPLFGCLPYTVQALQLVTSHHLTLCLCPCLITGWFCSFLSLLHLGSCLETNSRHFLSRYLGWQNWNTK